VPPTIQALSNASDLASVSTPADVWLEVAD
jgi:hypothetical protein